MQPSRPPGRAHRRNTSEQSRMLRPVLPCRKQFWEAFRQRLFYPAARPYVSRKIPRLFPPHPQAHHQRSSSVAHRIRAPRFSVQIHERKQQRGVDAAAQQQSNGHVAEQVPFYGSLYSSSNSSRASPTDFTGEKGTGLNRYHRRSEKAPFSKISMLPGASFFTPANRV